MQKLHHGLLKSINLILQRENQQTMYIIQPKTRKRCRYVKAAATNYTFSPTPQKRGNLIQ